MIKCYRVITIIAILFLSLNINVVQAASKEKKNVVFEVEMDCQSCVTKIEGNISYEKGVLDMKVSLENKEVIITFRSDKTSEEKLIKAFKKLGYTAKVKIPEDQKQDTKTAEDNHVH